MNRLLIIIFALLCGALPASAAFHGSSGAAPASCPYADTSSTDGCLNAPVANAYTVQHSDFFTSYALQSGQSYTGAPFTGAISGGVLTVSGASGTVIAATDTIIGAGVLAGVHVASFGTGTGGNGTYNLANASGLTVGAETMNGVRRPPWNVAGVDYPVGIKTFPNCATGGAPGGGTYVCLSSGLKDPSSVTNLTLDSVYSTSNGCEINSTYLVKPSFYCNGASAPTTITLDGYDFCSTNSTGSSGLPIFLHGGLNTASHITFKNSYICPGDNTWGTSTAVALANIQGGGSLTFEYDYIDGLGSIWKRNSPNPGTVGIGIDISGVQLANTNNDCVTGGPGICVQYSLLTRVSRGLTISLPSGCSGGCQGFVFQNNYEEDGNAPYTQFTGYVGDGTNTTTPGNCLSITAYAYGSLISGMNVQSPGLPVMATTDSVTGPSSCDTSGNPSVLSSWTITSSKYPAYAASQTMYGEDGEHGDAPIYLSFGTAGNVIPSILYAYNTVMMTPNTFGTTGLPTFSRNATSGTITTSTINNNVAATNEIILQPNAIGQNLSASSVMGSDSNGAIYGALNVTNNFLDPTGAANCFLLGASGSGVQPTLTGNVNMLGNGSGAPDSTVNSNTGTCYGKA
jgi:hypothetical protein